MLIPVSVDSVGDAFNEDEEEEGRVWNDVAKEEEGEEVEEMSSENNNKAEGVDVVAAEGGETEVTEEEEKEKKEDMFKGRYFTFSNVRDGVAEAHIKGIILFFLFLFSILTSFILYYLFLSSYLLSH